MGVQTEKDSKLFSILVFFSIENFTKVALECEKGEEKYVRGGFMVSCIFDEIIGCVDINGDLVRSGYYLLSNYRLRFCLVFENGRRAISENKGIIFKFSKYIIKQLFHVLNKNPRTSTAIKKFLTPLLSYKKLM